MTDDLAIGDHYRAPPTGDRTPGVYRVVGVDDEVVLLRLTTGEGRRVNTGDLATVPPEELSAGFEPADDPDAGFSPVRGLVAAVDGLVWEFRSLLGI